MPLDPRVAAAAVELATKAVALEPANRLLVNTLGVARYRAGDWQGAVDDLRKSVEPRSGGDPMDWLFLAMAEWHLGNKDEARKWYEKSVDWMERKAAANEELTHFHAEAAGLLGVDDKKQPRPSTAPTTAKSSPPEK